MSKLFGRGAIINNKIKSRYNESLYEQAARETVDQHRLIHWGLVDTLKKHDENAQEFLNTCDEYPERLPLGNVKEMEKIFLLLSDRINYALIEDNGCTCSDLAQTGLEYGAPLCPYCEIVSAHAPVIF